MILAISLVSLAYVVSGLIYARLLAGHIAYRLRDVDAKIWRDAVDIPSYDFGFDNPPDFFEWLVGWSVGLVVGVVWPAALLLQRIRAPSWPRRYTIGAEAENIRRCRTERVARLERELDL